MHAVGHEETEVPTGRGYSYDRNQVVKMEDIGVSEESIHRSSSS